MYILYTELLSVNCTVDIKESQRDITQSHIAYELTLTGHTNPSTIAAKPLDVFK